MAGPEMYRICANLALLVGHMNIKVNVNVQVNFASGGPGSGSIYGVRCRVAVVLGSG